MAADQHPLSGGALAAVWALASVLALAACQRLPQPPRFDRPPIIIVDIDTLRADHLGVYGYQRPTSPHLDAFSRRAVRFAWAFSQAPNTPPSQASILTGLYPTVHGRIDNQQAMSKEVTTLAEVLRDAGYRTGAFVDGGLMVAGFGLDRGFEVYDDAGGGLRAVGPKAMAWLERQREPFLLLIHSYDVHSPYEITPEPFKSMFLDGLALPSEDFMGNLSAHMAAAETAYKEGRPQPLSAAEVGYARAIYDGGIRHVDSWFGRFLAALRRMELFEPSIVVFISDHGDAFQEHGELFHGTLYRAVTHVPLIVKPPAAGPGRPATAGRVVDTVVETIDLVPTLLELVGVPPPADLDGNSMVPMIAGRDPGRRSLAFSESPFVGRRIAVTTDSYRLLINANSGFRELYAYRDDRREAEDLSRRAPGVADYLTDLAYRWDQAAQKRKRVGTSIDNLSPETVEQLRALGYID